MFRRDSQIDLLLGLLALQVALIDQDRLVLAFRAWSRAPGRSMAEILVEQGAIDEESRSLLEAMARKQIQVHGGDAEKSLGAVGVASSTRYKLEAIADDDLSATLSHAGPAPQPADDSDQTLHQAVGSSTSAGQRFRVLRPHAQGGLGAVFVALDGELNREVALKQILGHHADDPLSRTRFLIEAEITGGLEHPGIVPVYGLGRYEDGRPYYAMRFIRGDTLREAITAFHAGEGLEGEPGQKSLALRKLLRRFVDVCNAVDYAHGRGVLHRDLKPSNVIVGKHGETLVVDWGLAKPMGEGTSDGRSDERTLRPSTASGSAETLPGSAIGTPSYMSPEQAAGDLAKLGPRSDVYSLGATLYCLLTGRAPFEGPDLGAILYNVKKGAFPPPRQVDPSIDRALEVVCLKAMATNPETRHATARALADDVERWAADEPVSAWREPWSLRARRWMRRNRTAVTAASAAVLVALIGLASVLAVQSRANADLRDANNRVQARFELAREAIASFQKAVTEDEMLKNEELRGLRNQLLRNAAGFHQKLETLLQGQADRPSRVILAQSYARLAKLTEEIGIKPEALAVQRQALAIRRELAARTDADASARIDLAQSLIDYGAFLDEASNDHVGALAAFEEARDVAAPLALGSAPIEAARELLGFSHNRIGSMLEKTDKPAEALAEYRKALAIRETLVRDNPSSTDHRTSLADSHNSIGILLADIGRIDEALAVYREALTIRKKLAEDHPTVVEFRSRWSGALHNLGNLLRQVGKPLDAMAAYREAMAIRRKLAEERPAITRFHAQVADSHESLGNVLRQIGNRPEALAEHREALTTRKKLAEEHPTIAEFRNRLAGTYRAIGVLLDETGRPAEGLASALESLAIRKKLAEEDPNLAGPLNDLAAGYMAIGIMHSSAGRPTEALASFREALTIQRKLAENHPSIIEYRSFLAGSLNNVGLMLTEFGQTTEALAMMREALAIKKRLVDDHPSVAEFRSDLANTHDSIGFLLNKTGSSAEGLPEFDQARAVYEALIESSPAVPKYRDYLAGVHTDRADALRALKRPDESIDDYGRAIAILETLSAKNPTIPIFRGHLGTAVRRQGLARAAGGDIAGAVADQKRASSLFEGMPPRSGEDWYELACVRSALAGLAGREGSGIPAVDGRIEADRAMGLLRRAAARGYRDLGWMRREAGLDPLRSRPDFRLLMMDLAFPTRPFAD